MGLGGHLYRLRWASLELGFGLLVDLGQARDAVPLQAAVQGRAGELRDGGLQGVEAVVQQQQGVAVEGHDENFLLSG
jgi:hypothetical protein